MFRFKQFSVDQSGCAMKINTDGVLLGAMANGLMPETILDIGTGTGVIALMMAQRFPHASIDAVELDTPAAETAGKNFSRSAFSRRLTLYPVSFEAYFTIHPDRVYDLIISNPPFYINSLQANGYQKNIAKHADGSFFEQLIKTVAQHLTPTGQCWLVLPEPTAALVKLLAQQYHLRKIHTVYIHSFTHSNAHRQIVVLSPTETKIVDRRFVIYDEPKVYSSQYQECLKDFFTIF